MTMPHPYLALKLSWGLFQKTPEALSRAEHARLLAVARKQQTIERHLLASAEATSVFVGRATLCARLDEIRQRYQSGQELADELQRIGLNEEELAKAVQGDLLVEALLDRVTSAVAPVSAVDAEIYYHLHPQSFARPEARRLRHILITFDNAQERALANAQLETLRVALERNTTTQFGAAARHHSHCPSAMDGGQLGIVRRQQLYPELDALAFALAERELSTVVESPIGLHVLRCDEVLPNGTLPFAEIRKKIIERLTEQRRAAAQRDWIRSLFANSRQQTSARS
ncbi:MAG: nitrogen fixation protein NifM [Candidatus Accumulibacter phosphatis]|jgi:peptidyl-prolyl cis-trans isomerase C|uniref:nitrogen fixation protein NifM n=1 Tax=Candidatus Accumulibacter sp. ACC012 TaxID=2823332 RepID=UPI0025BB7D26|nr:nitrogen fixation protein NifM [Candidatus Accumulibacter sp. ACC012]